MEFSRMFKNLSPKAILSYLDSAFSQKNKKQVPSSTRDEIIAKIDFLKGQYMNDADAIFSIEGFLDAIKANDVLLLKRIIDELDHNKMQLSDKSKAALIFIAAGLGRVTILEVMRDFMDAKLVREDALAYALLSHPCREMINNVCSEHLDGRGKFNENFAIDMSLLLAFVKNQQGLPDGNKRQEFDTAIILNELDVDGFVNYLQSLKRAHAASSNEQLASSFIIAKNYLTSGEIIIKKDGDKINVTVLCFDLKDALNLQKKNFTRYFDAIRKVFPEAEFYVSESKLPFPSESCNVFNLLQALQALHNNAAEVIAFAKENVRQDVAIGAEGGVYHYQIFKTPLQLSAGKSEFVDANSTVVTRAGFMGVASKQSINRFYNPKRHHHSVDAFTEVKMAQALGGMNNDNSYKIVGWLVNQSQDELENIMRQHTLAVFKDQSIPTMTSTLR